MPRFFRDDFRHFEEKLVADLRAIDKREGPTDSISPAIAGEAVLAAA